MANRHYVPFKNNALTQAAAQVDFDEAGDDIRLILIDTADYTVDTAVHDFLDDVPGAARVATAALANQSVTTNVFDADDVTFSAVTGDSVEAMVLYKHTGVDSTARLIAYFDTATNMPVTPNGGDITVAWDNGANKIFAL